MRDLNIKDNNKGVSTLRLIVVVLLTALVVGGGVYAWQEKKTKSFEKKVTESQKQINQLKDQTPTDENEPPQNNTTDKNNNTKSSSEDSGDSESWGSYQNEETGISFRYPRQVDGDYIKIYKDGWPQIFISKTNTTIDCPEKNDIKTEFGYGKKEQVTVDGTDYCVTVGDQGATGRIYSTYSYLTNKFERLITLQFTLVYPNCDAYPQDKRQKCQKAQRDFEPHQYAHSIIETLTLNSF